MHHMVLPGHAGSIVNDGQVGDIVEGRGDARLTVRDLTPASGSGSPRHVAIIHVRGSRGYSSNLQIINGNVFTHGGKQAGLIAVVLNVRGSGNLMRPMSPYHLVGFHSG